MLLMLLLGLGDPLGWGLLGAWAQAPGTRLSDSHRLRPPAVWDTEAEDVSRGPIGRNWCPYQKSRLVTFVAACKTEKFLVHLQQPCPPGALECQRVKVMYRVAHRPVYQVKQKVLVSLAWRCCAGFTGPDCQQHDPTATPEPTEPSSGLQKPWNQLVDLEEGHSAAELNDVEVPLDQQKQLLGGLQNDVHQAADPWKALTTNPTATTAEVNQTELEFSGRTSEHVLMPHLDTVLQEHISPIWRSFNDSLHSLSQAIRNLTLDVEANRQAIRMVQEGTAARAEVQELGGKFEAKVQENGQRVDQIRQAVEDQLHAQHHSLRQALSSVQAEVETKLKHLLRAQELPGANGSVIMASAAAAAARPEPESLQARLGQLQRNLSSLHVVTNHREEELQSALGDMRALLAQHTDEIKELYSESDETFDQISKVERQVEELQVNHTGLRELRVILMEKSLIMEENKEEIERQLLELNLTVQHLQGGLSDLVKYVKDCNCQKLYFDLDVIREGQKDATRALEETQVSLDQRRQLDGSSLQTLQNAVDAVSTAVDAHKAQGEQARAERARLRSQLRSLEHAVGALKAAANDTRREMRQLHSSFAALLEDALRHEAVLAELFGEELMEEMSAETRLPLPLRYEQIRIALQDAASGLQEQALGWDALAARVEALEQASGAEPLKLADHPEPSHDAGREETGATALAELERELRGLGSDVKGLQQCCQASWATSFNGSLEDLRGLLADTQHSLGQHQRLFHSLFQNFQGLVAANISLDVGKLEAMLRRKGKKQQKGLDAPRKRDKKQVEALEDAPAKGLQQGVLGTELPETGSPVAFHASFSEETAALQTVKFNASSIDTSSSYFPEHGYFRAPERGIYLFAVSVTFGPGPAAGQLVLGSRHRIPIYSTEQRGGGTATTFAMAELQKGERVRFELTQGSVEKRSPPGTTFGGFLLFKT